MKSIIGTIARCDNGRSRTYTQIQCDGCQRVTEVKGMPTNKTVEKAVERDCRVCHPVIKPSGSRGWWTEFGLTKNPYVYGPMPRLRTAVQFRIAEARDRGWVSWVWEDEYTEKRKTVAY